MYYSSMQVNMECGKSARAALGVYVVVSLMVFLLAQSQGIGKYIPA